MAANVARIPVINCISCYMLFSDYRTIKNCTVRTTYWAFGNLSMSSNTAVFMHNCDGQCTEQRKIVIVN